VEKGTTIKEAVKKVDPEVKRKEKDEEISMIERLFVKMTQSLFLSFRV